MEPPWSTFACSYVFTAHLSISLHLPDIRTTLDLWMTGREVLASLARIMWGRGSRHKSVLIRRYGNRLGEDSIVHLRHGAARDISMYTPAFMSMALFGANAESEASNINSSGSVLAQQDEQDAGC